MFNFWLCWVFIAARGLSLLAASRGCSSLPGVGFSLPWLLLRSAGSRAAGFSRCSMWAQELQLPGSRAQAQKLWCASLAVPRYVQSSRIRDRAHVSCIGRQVLYQ